MFGFIAFSTPPKHSRRISLVSVWATIGIAILAGFTLDATQSVQHVFRISWFKSAGIEFYVGMDSLSHIMLLLSGFTSLFAVLLACRSTLKQKGRFFGLILLMQAAINGSFVAFDLFVYYIFWELSLIPAIFLLLLWGAENNKKTTLLFFLYTLAGSLLMLLAIIWLGLEGPTVGFSFEKIATLNISPSAQTWLLCAFVVAYAIKIPIFPFHTWQADTYSTSPLPLTLMLAGIMLKMALFSLVRWVIPIAPIAFEGVGQIFLWLSVAGVVYASVIALQQQEIKRLFAWSSMAHVGLIAAGIFTLNPTGLNGAFIQMTAHTIHSAALLFIILLLTRWGAGDQMNTMGGFRRKNPFFGGIFLLIVFSSIAVPLTAGFPGELSILIALFSWNPWVALLTGLSVILGAVYMLKAYQSIMLGSLNSAFIPNENSFHLSFSEKIMLLFLAFLILFLGLFPQWVIDWVNTPIQELLSKSNILMQK